MKLRRRRRWVHGTDPRPGAPYTHLIRGKGDPERPHRHTQGKGDEKIRGWQAIRKTPLPELAAEIRELLEDGRPRTFNAIAVTLWARTADVMFETVADHALWSLVVAGELEHTLRAPILFRRRKNA